MDYWIMPAFERVEKDLKTRVDNLTRRVCQEYCINKKDIFSKRRLRYIVLPRQVAMYILHEYYNITYERIGAMFEKNHATVIHSCNAIENMMSYDKDLRNKINYLK